MIFDRNWYLQSSKGQAQNKWYRINYSTRRICLKHDFVQETNKHSKIHNQELRFSAQYFYELLWTKLEQFQNNFKADVNSYYEDQRDTTQMCK